MGFPVLDVFMVCIYGGLRVVWFLAFMVVCDCFLGFLVFRVLGFRFLVWVVLQIWFIWRFGDFLCFSFLCGWCNIVRCWRGFGCWFMVGWFVSWWVCT